MKSKVKVGVSNHHVHLTKETYQQLFGKDNLTLKKHLHQLGEFAAEEKVTIECGNERMENLRIIGPFRTYNQVEISASDARKLKVNPPVRRSGHIKDSVPVRIIGPVGSIDLDEGVILANRHVHFNMADAKTYNVVDGQKLYIKVDNEKGGIMKAEAKISANGVYELHIDTDDAFAFRLDNGDEVEVFDEI